MAPARPAEINVMAPARPAAATEVPGVTLRLWAHCSEELPTLPQVKVDFLSTAEQPMEKVKDEEFLDQDQRKHHDEDQQCHDDHKNRNNLTPPRFIAGYETSLSLGDVGVDFLRNFARAGTAHFKNSIEKFSLDLLPLLTMDQSRDSLGGSTEQVREEGVEEEEEDEEENGGWGKSGETGEGGERNVPEKGDRAADAGKPQVSRKFVEIVRDTGTGGDQRLQGIRYWEIGAELSEPLSSSLAHQMMNPFSISVRDILRDDTCDEESEVVFKNNDGKGSKSRPRSTRHAGGSSSSTAPYAKVVSLKGRRESSSGRKVRISQSGTEVFSAGTPAAQQGRDDPIVQRFDDFTLEEHCIDRIEVTFLEETKVLSGATLTAVWFLSDLRGYEVQDDSVGGIPNTPNLVRQQLGRENARVLKLQRFGSYQELFLFRKLQLRVFFSRKEDGGTFGEQGGVPVPQPQHALKECLLHFPELARARGPFSHSVSLLPASRYRDLVDAEQGFCKQKLAVHELFDVKKNSKERAERAALRALLKHGSKEASRSSKEKALLGSGNKERGGSKEQPSMVGTPVVPETTTVDANKGSLTLVEKEIPSLDNSTFFDAVFPAEEILFDVALGHVVGRGAKTSTNDAVVGKTSSLVVPPRRAAGQPAPPIASAEESGGNFATIVIVIPNEEEIVRPASATYVRNLLRESSPSRSPGRNRTRSSPVRSPLMSPKRVRSPRRGEGGINGVGGMVVGENGNPGAAGGAEAGVSRVLVPATPPVSPAMSLWNALLTCIVKHNAKVMQVSQAEVVCRQLAEEEKYSTRLDVLSGFSLSDRKRRILLVEGLHPDVHEMLFFARKLFNPADNAKRFLLRRGTTRHLNKLRIRRESVAVAPDEDMAALFRSPQSGAGSSPGGGDQSSGLTSPMSSGFSPPHGMSALAPEDRPQLAEKNRGGVRQLLGLLRESQRSSDSPPARIFFHDNLRYFRRQYADFDLFPKPISLRVSVEEALLRPSLYECKTKADCSAVVTLEKILSIDRLKHGAHLLKAMNLFPNAVDLVRLEALYGDGSVSKGYVPPTDAGVQKKKGATETENTSAAVVGERKVAIGLPGSVGEVLQVVRFEDGTKGGGKGAGSRRPRSAGSENGSPHLQGKKPTSAERKRRDGSPRLQQQSHTWNLTFLKTLAKRKDRQEFVRKKSPKKAESFLNQIAASLLQGSSQGDSNVQLTSTSTANTSATAAMKKMSTVVPDAEQDGRNSPKNGLSRGASTMGNKNGVSRGATGDLAAKDMTDGGGGKSFARTGVTNFAAKLWSKAKSGTAMLSGRNERTPLALNATDKENLLNKSASFAPVSSALAEKMKKMAQMKRAASGLAVETNMVDVVSKRNSPLASAKKSSPTSPQQSPRGAAQIQLMNQRRDIAAPRQTTPETEPATDGLGGNLASALGQLVGGPSSPTGRDKKKRGSVLASPFGADEPMGLGRSGSPRSGMAPLSASDLSFDETDAVVSMQARRKTRITAADFGRLLASSSKKKRDSGGNENIGFGGGGGLGGQREDIGSIQGSHKPGSLGSSHASDIVGAAQLLSFGKPAKGPQIQFKQFSIENVRKQPRTPRNNAPMKEHYKRMPVLLHTTPKARQVAKQLKSLFKDR